MCEAQATFGKAEKQKKHNYLNKNKQHFSAGSAVSLSKHRDEGG
jgi:hypothetical protein